LKNENNFIDVDDDEDMKVYVCIQVLCNYDHFMYTDLLYLAILRTIITMMRRIMVMIVMMLKKVKRVNL